MRAFSRGAIALLGVSVLAAGHSPVIAEGVYQTGTASYYWQPQPLASGGVFDPTALTAAHKTLPFGTKVRVTNLRNGKAVTVTINDRGPFSKDRIIDLSSAAAEAIDMKAQGVVPVQIAVLAN